MGLCSQAGLCPPAAPFRARPAGWWCSIGSAGSAVPWEALQRPALASGSVMQPLSELLWKTSGKTGTPQTCSLNCVRSAAPPPPRSTRLCFTLTVSTASPQMSDSRVWGRARPARQKGREARGRVWGPAHGTRHMAPGPAPRGPGPAPPRGGGRTGAAVGLPRATRQAPRGHPPLPRAPALLSPAAAEVGRRCSAMWGGFASAAAPIPPRRPGSEERGGAPRLLRTRSTVSRSARRSRPSRPAAFGPRGASLRGGRAGRGGIVACEADAILGRSAALRPPERGPGMRGLPREAPLETEALSIGAVSARVSQARLRRRAETRLPVLCRGPGPGLLPPAVARRPRPEPDPRPSAELPAGFGAAGGRAALNPCRERRGAGGSCSGLPSGPGCLPPPRTHRGAGCELLTCLRRHCPSLGGAYSIAGQGAERWLGLFGFFFFFLLGEVSLCS